MNPVTATYRVSDENPGHTTIHVYVGRNPGARGHAGSLTFRTDELKALTYDDGRIRLDMDPVDASLRWSS